MDMICYDHGINWIWYCELTINPDDTVTIHKHYRLHNYRDTNHPKSDKSYRMIEDDKRIVIGIKIGDKEYKVANPRHVFSYKE